MNLQSVTESSADYQICYNPQQVEGEFIPRPSIKKIFRAKVSISGLSLVTVCLKEGKKCGCSLDFLGARVLMIPHRSKAANNAYKVVFLQLRN